MMHLRGLYFGLAVTMVLSGCVSSGGLFSAKGPEPLEPYGIKANAPAVIRTVESPRSLIRKGDTVLSKNGKPMSTLTFFTHFTPHGEIKIEDKRGQTRTLPESRLLRSDGNGLRASPLPIGGALIFSQKVPAYKRKQQSAFVLLGRGESGLVAVSLWNRTPKILEIYVELRAGSDCKKCSLNNLAVMDWSHKAWLSPVSYTQAAWIVYPADAPAGALMNVPPPTPIQSTSTSTVTGSLNGEGYRNHYYGRYTANATTVTTPYYNYTETDMALANDLATELQQDRIEADNRNRRSFVANRLGNLKAGPLARGEIMAGYVDVVVPKGFNGPYIVVIKGNGKLGVARFDLPEHKSKRETAGR